MTSELAVTIVDVGWGDSIFLESTDSTGKRRFAVVDCNDYETERSAFIYIKRLLQRRGIEYEEVEHNFEWVLLTHGHADHARGLKRILASYGTKQLWYPKSVPSTSYGALMRFANRSRRVGHHQAIDRTKRLPAFGDVTMDVLWPEYGEIDASNENNNSVVLALTLGDVTFVLTGDAEADNWARIAPRLPTTTKLFQSPHHGAENGFFDSHGAPAWLGALPAGAAVCMSCHIRPHDHPHPAVVAKLEEEGVRHYRTDRHSHLTFRTDGKTVTAVYSHEDGHGR